MPISFNDFLAADYSRPDRGIACEFLARPPNFGNNQPHRRVALPLGGTRLFFF